jgi:uncharacterized YigZ family protein
LDKIDHYLTIAEPALGEFRDRGSKFFAYAYPVYNEKEWQTHLEALRKEHFKARHHCYAFRLGLDKNNFRANDDGEPSGTAGRPILGQIDALGLTYVLVVVVRYFGGTLLGTSGLINAYKLAAADALQNAQVIERTVEDVYLLDFDYGLMSQVMNVLKKLELDIVAQVFDEKAKISVAIRQSEVEETILQLKTSVANVSREEAALLKSLAGLSWQLEYTR